VALTGAEKAAQLQGAAAGEAEKSSRYCFLVGDMMYPLVMSK